MSNQDKQDQFRRLCETQPHKAATHDLQGYVEHVQRIRRKLYGHMKGFEEWSTKQITESLEKTRKGKGPGE